jgi:hypothetical protein
MEKIVQITIDVLKAMGYEPHHEKNAQNIYFTSFGYESFKEKDKDIIRAIMGDSLIEFYYESNTQYIYYG